MMVEQIVDTVKMYQEAFKWVAKFGSSVAIGIWLVWFMCRLQERFVDHIISQGEKAAVIAKENADSNTIIAVASQRIADDTTANKAIAKAVLDKQASDHAKQDTFTSEVKKRIDDQDTILAKIDKQSADNGAFLKQNGETQKEMLGVLQRIEKQGGQMRKGS